MPAPLDAATFEQAARERLAALAPETDLEAMALVFNLIRVAGRIVGDVEANVHRRMGGTWAGFRILWTLWLAGPLEPAGVARLAGVTRASISSALNTLERDGFVERTPSVRDGRSVTVSLTSTGEARVVDAFRRQHERERAWVEPLSGQERAALLGMLRRLLAHRPPA